MVWLVVRVVKSERINGQPRQYLVQHLGSIRPADIHLPGARRRFWDRVDDRLAVFPLEVRRRFEDAIEARISRPPAEDGLGLAEQIKVGYARMQAAKAALANQEEIAS